MQRTSILSFSLLFALALPAFATVSVSAPGNGASVTTPFNLVADSSSCSNQTVTAMGYSLDNSSDTTIVHGTSINAQVPAAAGQHTLHVKSWGSGGAGCVTDVAIDVTGTAAATDGVNVSTPGNGSTLTSPFQLSATSATCDGQPVAAMSYSIDNNADIPAVYSKSLSMTVSASSGGHTLHVKSWGNSGAGCVANIGVNITGPAAAAETSPASGTSADGINVSSPGNGAAVASTFSLAAQASDCSSEPVTAMGYSLDNSSDTTIVKSSSVEATVTAAAGAHTLHVKSWGNEGAGCVANIPITVSGAAAAASSSASQGITVSSPANGASVSSTFNVVASAGSCDGQPVAAMAYSIDSGADAPAEDGGALNQSAYAGSGGHTLHVKSWGNQGAGCVENVAITVGGGTSSSSGPSIPSNAVSVSSLQTMGNWKQSFDAGTTGSASGSMALVGSPTLAGDSRQFITNSTGGGGMRYYLSFGDDTTAQNFVYDAWVYLDGTAGNIANLELDMNQVMPNGQTVIYGFQCDGYNGVWDYNENAGSPTAYRDHWVQSSAPCNARNWSRNAWHHIQISYSRDSSGDVTYHSVWLDGQEQAINATVHSAFALGWAPSLVTNFQVDGIVAGGSNTVYLDKLTIYRW